MARIQTMILPHQGDEVPFAVIIDEISDHEAAQWLAVKAPEVVHRIGAVAVLAVPFTLDVV